MLRERTLILCVCLFLLSGCVEPGSLNEERADTPPIHMSFEAPTLDRTKMVERSSALKKPSLVGLCSCYGLVPVAQVAMIGLN